jgi:hypothetical protein
VRAAEIELDAVGTGVLDLRQDDLPVALLARHHERDQDRPIRPLALELLDLDQIDLEGAVGDQLDVVEAGHARALVRHRPIARAGVDDRRILAQRLPDSTTPARPEGALDVVFLVGRRRRSQPERVGRLDAGDGATQIGHDALLTQRGGG